MKHLLVVIFTSLSLVSCKDNSPKKMADSFKEDALLAIDAKEYLSAITSGEEALKNYKIANDSIGIVESSYLIASASALSGDFNNAVKYGEFGSQLCKIIEIYPTEYKLNNTLSWAYFSLGKGFNEIKEHHKRQLFVVEQLGDDNAKAMVYNNYGYDATVSGMEPLEEAISYTQFANDHYAKVDKNNGRWYTLMNLSWQHRLVNDFAKSGEYGLMAVEQAEIDKDRHAIIEANTSLGETYLIQHKIEQARPLYERGLELSNQNVDRDKYVFDLYHSRYLWKVSKKEEAIFKLKTAISFLEKNEIFYEMLARAFLTDFSYSNGDIGEVKKQLAVFNDPRANNFSQECKTIITKVKAQILAETDKDKAFKFLENKLVDLDYSGAQLLKMEILELMERIKPSS